MSNHHPKLDNPVWYALTETHQPYALAYRQIRCYHPEYGVFGAVPHPEAVPGDMEEYLAIADKFYIWGHRPPLMPGVALKGSIPCLQMVLKQPLKIEPTEKISRLMPEDQQALYDLIDLVQPGYFRFKTYELGNYFGIFQNGQLVAVTGERIQMEGYTEVSGVVTRPGYTGRGFAKQLIAHTVKGIVERGHIPFLHVAANNARAIGLYERLGFYTRRELPLWRLVKIEENANKH